MKVVSLVFLILELSAALQPIPPNNGLSTSTSTLFSAVPDAVEEEDTAVKTCFWQTPIGNWEHRLSFESLKIGQELKGVVFQELLDGKTGGKLFMDCGVGRIDAKGDWQIVTGMHRIRDRKKSVIAKKAIRLRQRQGGVQLWVSRIYAPNFQFEVVAREEDVPPSSKLRIPTSSLEAGQELVGTIVRVESYGVFVDVGANRNGLLHIQRVADLFDHYIHKEEGLVEAGLEKGAKIRVAVSSNEKKRLFLDFPNDVKTDAKEENLGTTVQELVSETTDEIEDGSMSEEEMAAWAEFAAADTSPTASILNSGPESADDEAGAWGAYENGDDEDGDHYEDDEDRDIEDALGIGAY